MRPGRAGAVPRKVEPVEAVTRDDAIAAGRGCDVVLNAFNPAITLWQKNALSLALWRHCNGRGERGGAVVSRQRWNFGAGMPPVLDETTPMQPTTRKGAMRVEIEQRIREACDRGMRAIVLRAGDFFGGGRGSWFDLVIAKDIARQRLTYPGPLDVVHAWAYLPDFATTMIRLAEQRESFAPCETFGFPGHAPTGAQFIAAIEATTKDVQRAADELVDAQDVRTIAGDGPRVVRAGISLAGAARNFRRQAQVRDRRNSAHPADQGHRGIAARTRLPRMKVC